MQIFQYEQLCTLNESEFSVYNYVSIHLEEIEQMNIRELAKASGVSTTTILRFCQKIGYHGFTEFKYGIKKIWKEQVEAGISIPSIVPAIHYLEKAINSKELNIQLEKAAKLCLEATEVLFLGIGTSGSLCEYGARLLAGGAGIRTFAVTDPFYPLPIKNMEYTIVIILSVSGETPQIISQANHCKKRKAKIISMTNTSHSTIARLSDLNFSYYMPCAFVLPEVEEINLTTQLPVIYLLEALMKYLYIEIKQKSE